VFFPHSFLVSSLSNYGNQLKTLFKEVLTNELHFEYAPVKEWVSIFTKQLTALKEKNKELRKQLFAQQTFTKAISNMIQPPFPSKIKPIVGKVG